MGCDVNVLNTFGKAPLHCALRYFQPRNGCDITVLTYLINQKDVNLNIKDRNSLNLLHYACDNSDSRDSVELKGERDTFCSQIVEMIVESCVQQVLDEIIS
jgi:ankyrin repeat protein